MSQVLRGVIIIAMLIVAVFIGSLLAANAIEPIGEEVKGYDSIDEGDLEGTNTVNNLYDVVFKWVPLIGFFSFLTVAVLFALNRERFLGARRGGRF